MYNALQQEPGLRASEALSAGQREDLQAAVEKVRRQILRQSREFDSQILRERMEMLQQAQQVGLPCLYLTPHICGSPWAWMPPFVERMGTSRPHIGRLGLGAQ